MSEPTLRERSGSVNDNDGLVAFLYGLMRDHLPCGEVERIFRDHVAGDLRKSEYTNGWLARHAQDLASRIRGAAQRSGDLPGDGSGGDQKAKDGAVGAAAHVAGESTEDQGKNNGEDACGVHGAHRSTAGTRRAWDFPYEVRL